MSTVLSPRPANRHRSGLAANARGGQSLEDPPREPKQQARHIIIYSGLATFSNTAQGRGSLRLVVKAASKYGHLPTPIEEADVQQQPRQHRICGFPTAARRIWVLPGEAVIGLGASTEKRQRRPPSGCPSAETTAPASGRACRAPSFPGSQPRICDALSRSPPAVRGLPTSGQSSA